jgi:hypothetical protein
MCYLAAIMLLTTSGRSAEPLKWTATLKPKVNPALTALPNNTWKLMHPNGDTFDHPKTEVGLVYDEQVAINVTGHGAKKQTWVYRYRKAKATTR